MQWPWKTSVILMIFGFLVVFFSLQSMHGKVIAQGMANSEAELADDCRVEHWFDPSLPGSFPYTAQRAVEQVTLAALPQSAKPQEQCGRAAQRLEASRYAWEKNRRGEAARTIRKAFIYLSESQTADSTVDCSKTAQEIQKTVGDWCGQVNCQEISVLAKTKAQIESFQ